MNFFNHKINKKIMKKMFLTIALAVGTLFAATAQNQGDWYVGTGDIGNVAWTEWSVSPTVGYGITENIMLSASVSQADSTADLNLDVSARYFRNGYFAYVSTTGLSTDNLKLGVGRLFTIHKGVYVDPKLVYDTNAKTTNLLLGFGLKF
jgi:hypothetical protein